MEYIFSEIVLAVIGWLNLFMRYPNFSKMIAIKDEEYGGEYSNVGKVKGLQSILIKFIIFLLVFFLMLVIGIF